MTTAIIVQARMGSTRLPGKVLMNVINMPMLEFQVRRLNLVSNVDEIIIATSTNISDDKIENLAIRINCKFYRGSEEDVLDRFYNASKLINADCVIRINADCPLIDPIIINTVLDAYLKNKNHYDYVSNILEPGYPIGCHTEVFSFNALERAFFESKDPLEREHVTPYIYRNTNLFKILSIQPNLDMSKYRLTVDYPEDYKVISLIANYLYPTNPFFSMGEIINFLQENPDIHKINSHFTKNQTL